MARPAGSALVRVRGPSMAPTLGDGDLLLVRDERSRPGSAGSPSSGLPGDRPVAVKRVRRPQREDGWWVEGDNPGEGVDSWQVGAVPGTDVRGPGAWAGCGRSDGVGDRPALWEHRSRDHA